MHCKYSYAKLLGLFLLVLGTLGWCKETQALAPHSDLPGKEAPSHKTFQLPDGTVVERITGPQFLPLEVQPYWHNHYAIYVFRNDKLGYKAFLGIHKVQKKTDVVVVPGQEPREREVLRCIGGTAMERHARPEDAMIEALLLSRQMSYKAALVPNMPVRGGKFVIDFDNTSPLKNEVLISVASALDWISEHQREGIHTGQDVGISFENASLMYEYAPTSIVGVKIVHGRKTFPPTPPTAVGVLAGMRAAVEELSPENPHLTGKVVSLAGLGGVGSLVLKGLLAEGAIVYASEPVDALRKKIEREHADAIASGQLIIVTDPSKIYDARADIFCPCTSERRILDEEKVYRLKRAGVWLIAGSSNTQLHHESIADLLHRIGIFYVEDVVINAGGYMGVEGRESEEVDRTIYANVKEITRRAKNSKRDPHTIFMELAEERMQEKSPTPENRLVQDFNGVVQRIGEISKDVPSKKTNNGVAGSNNAGDSL